MIKNAIFKPKHIKFEEIRNIAEKVRQAYCEPPNLIPVPIEEIIEFDLNINIVPIPGLNSSSDIEAFLSNDLESIYVDAKLFSDERYLKRLRFTFAHEIGHFFIHEDIIKSLTFGNYEEWIEFIREVDPDDFEWFEKQAHEFGGRLLVPRENLRDLVLSLKPEIENYIKKCKIEDYEFDKDSIITGISKKICDKFMVSHDVIKTRIFREGIIDELDLNKLFV